MKTFSWIVVLFTLIFVNHSLVLKGEPIQTWVVWGPGWGRGGLAAISNGYEGRRVAQPGDQDYDLRTDVRKLRIWQPVQTKDGVLNFFSSQFPDVTREWDQDAAYPWAGATMYALTYFQVPTETKVRIKINSPQPFQIWLNGQTITAKVISLKPGWNRLLIKSWSPSLVRGSAALLPTSNPPGNWFLQVHVTGMDGLKVDQLRIDIRDPDRRTVTDHSPPLRFLSTIGTKADLFPLFVRGREVVLPYQLQVGVGPADNYAPAPKASTGWPWVYSSPPADISNKAVTKPLLAQLPVSLDLQLLDYDRKILLHRQFALKFTSGSDNETLAVFPIAFGKLPVGHYTIVSKLLDAEGRVVIRDFDHSFAVLYGPVDRSQDDGIRRLSCVGHWLLDTGQPFMKRLDWLYKVGITRHVKCHSSWGIWNVSHDMQGNVKIDPNPRLDQALKRAKELGITMVGNLDFGYVTDDAIGGLPPLTGEEQEAVQKKARMLNYQGPLTLRLIGAAPLPAYGSTGFEKTLQDFAFLVVNRYKDRIKYWAGCNEINHHSGKSTPAVARMYVDATRAVYRGMKRADPGAIHVGPSITRNDEFVAKMFEFGFGNYVDILDVHVHPADPPDPVSSSGIENCPAEGLGAVEPYDKNKPIWYGELSAPLAHHPEGCLGQASAVVEQLCWAIRHSRVQALAYLVMYSSPTYEGANLGFNNLYGDPLPAVCSANVASHLLDGRTRLPELKGLPKEVFHLRMTGPDGRQTLVLWSHKSMQVYLNVEGNQVDIIDLIGRSNKITPKNGKIKIDLSATPVYLRGIFKPR